MAYIGREVSLNHTEQTQPGIFLFFFSMTSLHQLSLLPDVPEPVSDSHPDLICLPISLPIAPVPNKVKVFNFQSPPGFAWVIPCNADIVQGYAGHYDMSNVL